MPASGTRICKKVYPAWVSTGLNGSNCLLRCSSRGDPLLLGLIGLLLPFANFVLVGATQLEKLFFVIDQFVATGSSQRIVLHQENGFFGTHFLAVPAKNATKHVDFKFLGRLLDIPNLRRARRARWYNTNGFRRAHELTQLAGDTLRPVFLVLYQV